ncbi:MAG: sugar ABC transporter ATP-binding protein [Intestinibacillus sp.]
MANEVYLVDHFAIELRNITKSFPGVTALNDMSLELRQGEIHGLIGENGAGKSTLIKVLTGMHQPDKGEIFVNGEKVAFHNPEQARAKGIACVYQELNIVPDANIVDNIFLGSYKTKNRLILDQSYMQKRAKEIMQALGQEVDLTVPCGTLGMGMQQMIEIAKAIQLEANVIILDEPTASLGEQEVEQLFKSVRLLRDKGITFLFVSHKLEEIFELCDRVTVMRDAKHIITTESENLTKDSLISHMVGRTLENLFPKTETHRGGEALRVEGLTRMGEFYDMSFTAYKGEVLGFSGLVGAGRTELFQGIFGMTEIDRGTVYINGKQTGIHNPRHAIENQIAFLTEDRKHQGLILESSVRENLNLVLLDQNRKGLFLDEQRRSDLSADAIDRLRIKVSTDAQLAGQLSGGNQQKVVIGKWVATNAEIFIFDEPTKGIDVGAKIEVYNVMNALVAEGKCVIMISSELPEILGMSDRVIVMREGRKMAEIDRDSRYFNQEAIMKAAWGGKLDEE